MSNIVPDNSNTIFSSILEDLRNLCVIFSHANKSEKTLKDYFSDDNLDNASAARILQKSLDDIEQGKHLQLTTTKSPTINVNVKNIKPREKALADKQIPKVEKITNIKINKERELDDR